MQEVNELIRRASEPDDIAFVMWRWEDAPGEFRRLSGHGGDEDWVLWTPDADRLPLIFDSYSFFGWPEFHRLHDGSCVVIFAHA